MLALYFALSIVIWVWLMFDLFVLGVNRVFLFVIYDFADLV